MQANDAALNREGLEQLDHGRALDDCLQLLDRSVESLAYTVKRKPDEIAIF